jgi:hypothetical protein
MDTDEEDPTPDEKVGESLVKGLVSEFKPLLDALKGVLKGLKNLPKHLGLNQELSYEGAMKYFITHQNDKPEIAKGAILKENLAAGFKITQVFLDKSNAPVTGEHGRPLGYYAEVQRLDKELLDLFKDNDVVIVE